MVRLDGKKLQEIKDGYSEQSKREIAKAVNDPDTEELTVEDTEAIKNKWQFAANREIEKLKKIGPQRLFRLGFAHDANGWRAGYTKPTLESRTTKRRTQNKNARKARKLQRNLQRRK
jgi:hypothetical protein